MNDIGGWLAGLGLEQYAASFDAHAVDADVLPHLDHDLLRQIGVEAVGHRVRILKAVEQLAAPQAGSAAGKSGQVEASSATALAPTEVSAAAERRQLTVMFVDLVGSTAMSRELDPEELRDINRAFQDATKAAIEQFGGYVARYMGDGVLAYFGFPQAHEDDAERAVRSGLAVIDAIAALEPGDLAVRVGIATGPVVVGDIIGEGGSQESAVVGETPNLASRLQGLADPGTVLVSEATGALIGTTFRYESLAPQIVKGFSEPVGALRVIEPRAGATRFEARRASALGPMIGRDSELAMVQDRWEQARNGDGQLVLISGEAGIGKSRLVHAFQASLEDDEPISLAFQCSPHQTRSPFLPVIGGLDRAAGIGSADDDATRRSKIDAWLSRISPADSYFATLARALALPDAPALSIPPRELHLQFLVSLIDSPARPVVLLFEDMHWADPTTLEAATVLVESLSRDRVLVLMTARPEFEPPWPAPEHCTTLTLNRLGRRQRAALISALSGADELDEDVLERIIEQTDGVPLFVEEVLQAILGSSAAQAGRSDSTVPATLHDSLLERLDRLGDAKRVAQRAAVIGRDFSRDLLARVVAPMGVDLDGAMARLLESGLVLERRGAVERDTYSFKHALVRDAAYESMLRAHRREAHAAIAAALEADGSDDANIEQLAWHYEGAGQLREAVQAWSRAALLATQRSALLEATALAESGLRVLHREAPSPQRDALEIELQYLRGFAARFLYGNDAPVFGEALTRVRKLSERTGDRRLTTALFQLTMYHWGRYDIAAMHQMNEAIAPYLDSEVLADRLLANTVAVAAHIWSDTPRNAQPHVQCLYELLEDEGAAPNMLPMNDLMRDRRAAEGVSRIHICRAGYVIGEFDKALKHARRALANSEQINWGTVIPTLSDVAALHIAVGDTVRGLEYAQRLLDLATRARQFAYVTLGQGYCLVASTLGGSAQRIGELASFEAAADPDDFAVNAIIPFMVSALLKHSAWASVDSMVERRLPRAERLCWMSHLAALQRAKAVSAAFQARPGDDTEAMAIVELERIVEQGLACGARPQALDAATHLAHIYMRTHRRSQAHQVLARAYGTFTEGFATPLLRQSKTLLEELAQ